MENMHAHSKYTHKTISGQININNKKLYYLYCVIPSSLQQTHTPRRYEQMHYIGIRIVHMYNIDI